MSRRDLLAVALCLGLSGVAAGKTPVRKPPTHVVLDYRRQAGAERCLRRPSWRRKSATSSDAPRSPGPRPAPCGACSGPRAVVSLPAYSSWTAARVRCSACASSPVPVPACEELGGAVAFAIALAIDPLARPPARSARGDGHRHASHAFAGDHLASARARRAGARVAFVRPRGHRGLRGRRRRRGVSGAPRTGPPRGLSSRPTPGRSRRSASSRWRSRRPPTRAARPTPDAGHADAVDAGA